MGTAKSIVQGVSLATISTRNDSSLFTVDEKMSNVGLDFESDDDSVNSRQRNGTRRSSSSPKPKPGQRQGSPPASFNAIDGDELGGRVERGKQDRMVLSAASFNSRLWTVVLTGSFSFLFLNAAIFVVVDFLTTEMKPETNTTQQYYSFETRPTPPSPDHANEACFAEECRSQYTITDTSLIASLSDDEHFPLFYGIVLWLTVLLAGFGSELLFYLVFTKDGWTETLEGCWWFAQFLFSLFAATCVGLANSGNIMALPFLVVGLWKFGMPETFSYMYTALFDKSKSSLSRCGSFLNAVGAMIHHGAASIPITMVLAGVHEPSRYILSPILFLVMQHWFVLTKYCQLWFYTVVELALEVFFEWEVLSVWKHLHDIHWTLAHASTTMVVAHWLYLMAAGIELAASQQKEETKKSENHSS